MTTCRRHHRWPRRRHRRSCLRAVPAAASPSFLPLCCSRRHVTVVIGVVAVGVARHAAVALRRLLCAVRGGGGELVRGDGLEAAATGCVLESGGGGGHRDLGGVAVALQRLLHAVRGGGGSELVRGDGLEAAATGCVLESGGGGGHGDLGAEAQQRRGVWGPRDRVWWCGGLHARNVVPGVEGVAGVQRQHLEEDH
ncbi:hypothetical protein EDB85DRAFT_1888746 [Lactarius pseudohatsudake]|nr:hypothetical protein EDB85DRAFT_1888746 [Lactarius pseudohatsudake]